MRVTFQVGTLTIGQEVKTVAEAFEFGASVVELFGEPCGCCKSKDVEPTVQKFGDKVFRKLRCRSCTATLLLFARRDDGGMFPARQDKDKKTLPNRGWSIYKKDGSAPTSQAQDTDPRDQPGDGSEGGEVPF